MATNQQLQQAYQLIRDGRKPEALQILLPIVRNDKGNADAWWLLANAVSDPVQARKALEQVLRLRPGDEKARRMLDRLNLGSTSDFPPATPSSSFSQQTMVSQSPRMQQQPPPSSDPFGSSDPFATNDPFAANDPFGSSDPFGSPPPRGQAPLGSQPMGGYGAPPPMTPIAQPKRSRGCSCFLIGCVVLIIICVGTPVLAAVFARDAFLRAIDEVSTQQPEVGNILQQSFGAILRGQTPDPTALSNSFLTAGVEGQLGSAFGTAMAGGTPDVSGILSGAAGQAAMTAAAQGTPIDPQQALGMLGSLLEAVSGVQNAVGAALPGNVRARGSIEYGQTVTGTTDSNIAGEIWVFNGRRGDILRINVNDNNGSTDPTVALYGPDNTQIAFDDDGGEGLNSQLEFTLPNDGPYTILVGTFFGGDGSYQMTLTKTN
ncbi:hypothetical protein FBR02_18395 [Anaerolineae bacterium CFX9]|nr:hypothetical protein [Anaerolineae bacterium CFX9]